MAISTILTAVQLFIMTTNYLFVLFEEEEHEDCVATASQEIRLESSPKTAKINSEVLTSISRRPKRTKFRHHQSLRTAPLRKQKAKRLSTEDFLPRPLLARRTEIKYEGKEGGKQRNSQQIRNTIPLLQHFYATSDD